MKSVEDSKKNRPFPEFFFARFQPRPNSGSVGGAWSVTMKDSRAKAQEEKWSEEIDEWREKFEEAATKQKGAALRKK